MKATYYNKIWLLTEDLSDEVTNINSKIWVVTGYKYFSPIGFSKTPSKIRSQPLWFRKLHKEKLDNLYSSASVYCWGD
jgi:hypothetical protein